MGHIRQAFLDDEVKLSKKKRKLQNQMKIGELKQVCEKPEVVEVWDVTAADPRTLVYLKVCKGRFESIVLFSLIEMLCLFRVIGLRNENIFKGKEESKNLHLNFRNTSKRQVDIVLLLLQRACF